MPLAQGFLCLCRPASFVRPSKPVGLKFFGFSTGVAGLLGTTEDAVDLTPRRALETRGHWPKPV